jgi:hypothetical protein
MYVRVCVCVCVCVYLYLATHHTHNSQTPMPPVEFESTSPADERPQMYALDRAAAGTCNVHMTCGIIYVSYIMPSMLKYR